MKIKIVNGALTIELLDMADSLSPEDKVALARQIVADEYLFSAVLECVATGEFFSDDTAPWWFDSRKVLDLREKLLPLMSEVAREAVKKALDLRNEAEKDAKRHSDMAWKLFHAWPADRWSERPDVHGWKWEPARKASDADVDAVFDEVSR